MRGTKLAGIDLTTTERYTARMITGLLLGSALFVAAALMGERNALWVPAVVLGVAGLAELLL